MARSPSSEGFYADRHYLTIVKRDCCCNRCGTALRVGHHECVYRHTPREILCLDCANRERVRYRLSRRWEAQNRDRNGKPTARRIGPTPAPESRR